MSIIGIALVYIFLVGGVLALVLLGVGSVLGTVSDALGDAARERARLRHLARGVTEFTFTLRGRRSDAVG